MLGKILPRKKIWDWVFEKEKLFLTFEVEKEQIESYLINLLNRDEKLLKVLRTYKSILLQRLLTEKDSDFVKGQLSVILFLERLAEYLPKNSFQKEKEESQEKTISKEEILKNW